MNNIAANDLEALVGLEKENVKRKQRQHNAALMVDFATNLLTMLSRNKGGRNSVATNYANTSNARLAEAQERLLNAQRDYNGRRAMLTFKDMLGRSNANSGGNGNYIKVPKRAIPDGSSLLSRPITLQAGLQKPRKPRLLDLSGYNKKNKYNNKK